MDANPLTPSGTRALLDRLGLHPRRSLGQNFLIDPNIVRKSLGLAGISPGDRVVEVGPGLGTLTGALLAAGAEVWAIELDPGLHAHLSADLVPSAGGRLHLRHGDAVADPRAGLPDDLARGPWKVVANLPYACSSPWLESLLDGPLPERMVLMLQREAAERYLAEPGTKAFGALSVFVQAAFERRPGHPVARSCFYPIPDIDSVLLHLVRRAEPFRFSPDARRALRTIFTQRRKQLGSILRRHPDLAAWPDRFHALGIALETRPEAVPVAAWQAVAG
jgi:16S rRNA (adenine1518-N6/adenine1519-N6)-dimethyltransferase